jgi:DNA-binding NtrC family response regulator
VLEERRVRRLGGRVEIAVDVRIISATNADIARLLRAGAFREDLYYRLNVFEIHLAPLRERTGDVPVLAHHFLKQLARDNGKSIHGFTDEALERLNHFDWPGNVRELRNAIERAVVVCSGQEIDVHHLPQSLKAKQRLSGGGGGVMIPPETPLEEAERLLILDTLDRTGGNKTHAARVLGITTKTLHAKLKRYAQERA